MLFLKIIVLNESPKSQKSVTMQSIKYLEQNYGNHQFEYIHIIKDIKKYEQSKERLETLCKKLERQMLSYGLFHYIIPWYLLIIKGLLN